MYKLFKYGCFVPLTTWGSWRIKKFKNLEEMLEFVKEQALNKRIPLHCAIGYFQKETMKKNAEYILKYKEGIYGG